MFVGGEVDGHAHGGLDDEYGSCVFVVAESDGVVVGESCDDS